MLKKITIAVDAMGGDNSPHKVVKGINKHYRPEKNVFYKIFGDSEKIKQIIPSSLPSTSFDLTGKGILILNEYELPFSIILSPHESPDSRGFIKSFS